MSDSNEIPDAFADAKLVAVIGGTIDCGQNLRESVRVCSIVEVGESDILVRDSGTYTERTAIVPKSLCVPIHATYEEVMEATPAVPNLGDLVLYYGKMEWKDKEPTRLVGILCEMKYDLGSPVKAKVLVGGVMKEVEYSGLLVLQSKK